VTTEDGYILQLYRIPKGKVDPNGKVCLFVHGVLDSADAWVLGWEDKSYAFRLLNSGYDVWFGNNRGNKYSRKHKTLNPDSNSEFWDFSYIELGKYDIPAMIDYVLLVSKAEKLTFFGHSQGTMQIFFASIYLNEYLSQRVNGIIALGPAAKLDNMSSALYYLLKYKFDIALEKLGIHEFLPNNQAVSAIDSFLCQNLKIFCNGIINMIADGNPAADDTIKRITYLSHYPSGASLKSISHMAQSIRSKSFAFYDYGTAENIKRYKQPTPPSHDLSSIKNLKFCIFAGTSDKMASFLDAIWIKEKLENAGVLALFLPVSNFGHLTFFIPQDFSLFNDMLNCMKVFETN